VTEGVVRENTARTNNGERYWQHRNWMIRLIILASGSAKPSEGTNIKHPNQSGKWLARDLVGSLRGMMRAVRRCPNRVSGWILLCPTHDISYRRPTDGWGRRCDDF
jgi:hypothetical protein